MESVVLCLLDCTFHTFSVNVGSISQNCNAQPGLLHRADPIFLRTSPDARRCAGTSWCALRMGAREGRLRVRAFTRVRDGLQQLGCLAYALLARRLGHPPQGRLGRSRSESGLELFRTEILSTYRKPRDLKYALNQRDKPCLFKVPP